ncbi:hypothetical protein BDV18DRAFT_143581 [Aspergillus unguis]
MAHVPLSKPAIRKLPRAGPLRLSHLQTRSLWGFSQNYNRDLYKKHIRLILSDHHRSQKPRRYQAPQDRDQRTIYPDYNYQSWRSPGWDWGGSWGWSAFESSRFPPESPKQRKFKESSRSRRGCRGRQDNDIWDWDYRGHAKSRMDRVRKEIDEDPYRAIFGRRLEPFNLGLGLGLGRSKLENGFTALCRSVLGLGEEKPLENERKIKGADKAINAKGTTVDEKTTVHTAGGDLRRPEPALENEGFRKQSPLDSAGEFEFDPISGPMVPQPSETKIVEESSKPIQETNASAVHDPKPELLNDLPKKAEEVVEELDESYRPGVDGTKQEVSAIPTTTEEPQENIEPNNTTHCQTPDIPLVSSENVYEPPEIIPYSIHRPPKLPKNFDENLCRAIDREWYRDSDSQWIGMVDRQVSNQSDREGGLNRAGFLSRRKSESETRGEDKNLESLSASDIRAAYEPRRLDIRSEIEAETRMLNGTSAPSMGPTKVDDQSMPSTSEVAEPSSVPEETHAAASGPIEQVLTEVPSQHEALSQPPAAETYRIFAYDPSSSKVFEAETTSSLEASAEHLHPTEVLTRLSNPAKFLPCLNQMHADGYEIVSGGGDILVFRRALDNNDASSDHEPILPASDGLGKLPGMDQCAGSPPKSRVRKALRRMLVGGIATGGTCYAIGVVIEYFKTGGEYGLMDSFTVFESERRHRD